MRPSRSRLLAGAVDDRRVVFVDDDLSSRVPRSCKLNVIELDAQLFRDELAAGEDRDVFEHRLAPIAEAGALTATQLQRAADLVDDESGERFAFDIFSDDNKRLARSWRFVRGPAEYLSCC